MLENILTILKEVSGQIDITVLVLLVFSLGLVMCMNIILGSVYAGITKTWDTKKFFTGIIKAILVGIVIIGFGWLLEFVSKILVIGNIVSVSDELIKLVEVIGVVLTAFKKYAKGVWDKLLVLLDVTQAEVDETIDDINGVVEEEIPDYETEVKGEG